MLTELTAARQLNAHNRWIVPASVGGILIGLTLIYVANSMGFQ